MIRKVTHFFLPLFLCGTLFLSSCSDDDDFTDDTVGPTQNMVQLLSSFPEYSTLALALSLADLTPTLEGSGPFTVFGPNNAAFTELFDELGLPAGSAEERLISLIGELGAEEVQQILRYHVIAGLEVRSTDLGENTYATTFSDASPEGDPLSLFIRNVAQTITLNGSSNVTQADLLATNGVLHGINSVLLLPNVVDLAQNNPILFSSLTDALVQADLVSTLEDPDATFTVFAPDNNAFASADLDGVDLSEALLYHVVSGNIRAADINEGPVITLNNGETFNIGFGEDNLVTITDNQGNVINVMETDVQGTNGVLHRIAGVLIP